VLEVLWNWKNTKKNKATYLKLVEYFVTIDDLETAEIVIEHVIHVNHLPQIPEQHDCDDTTAKVFQHQSSNLSIKPLMIRDQELDKSFSLIIFDMFYDDLAHIMCQSESLSDKLIDSLEANSVLTIAEKGQAGKMCHIIKSKFIIGCLSTLINRGKHPKFLLNKFLSIFNQFDELKSFVEEIKRTASLSFDIIRIKRWNNPISPHMSPNTDQHTQDFLLQQVRYVGLLCIYYI
jgi:hypothetical protein